jgi:hypothetical protein
MSFELKIAIEKLKRNKSPAHWLFIDSEKAYDSVRREELYNILIEFGIPIMLVRLTKTCLNEAYSKVQTSKSVSYISYSE